MLYLKEFIKSKQELNLKENTITTYENLLGRFNTWLCNQNNVSYLQKSTIINISTATIQKYVNELKSEYSKNTVVLHLASIKEYFNFLKYNSVIKENPCYGVRIPKDKTTTKKKHMTLTEGQSVLSSVTDIKDRAIMSLGMLMGLRREEIATLELSAFDLNNNTITFLRKGSKIQTLPIFESAMSAVMSQYNEAKSKGHVYLFQSSHGKKPITTVTVHNIVKKYSEYGVHENRRIAAKNLIANGIEINTVAKVLNHSNIGTTQRYIRFEDSEVLETLRRM